MGAVARAADMSAVFWLAMRIWRHCPADCGMGSLRERRRRKGRGWRRNWERAFRGCLTAGMSGMSGGARRERRQTGCI